MHVVKILVYGEAAVLTPRAVGTGLAIGLVMILGTYAGKRLLDRLPPHRFPLLVEGALVVSGVQLIVS